MLCSYLPQISVPAGPKGFVTELSIWTEALLDHEVRALYGSSRGVRSAGIDEALDLLGGIDGGDDVGDGGDGGDGGDEMGTEGRRNKEDDVGEGIEDGEERNSPHQNSDDVSDSDPTSPSTPGIKDPRSRSKGPSTPRDVSRALFGPHGRGPPLSLLTPTLRSGADPGAPSSGLLQGYGQGNGQVYGQGTAEGSERASEGAAMAAQLLAEALTARTACESSRHRLVRLPDIHGQP